MTNSRKRSLPVILLLLLSALVAIFTTHQAAAQTGVDMVVNPGSTTVNVGDTFTVDVVLEAGTYNINGVELYMEFNPAVLQVTPGGLQRLDSFASALEGPNVFNDVGHIDYMVGQFGGTLPTGTIPLLRIEFEAIAAGNSAIAFSFDASDVQNVRVTGVSASGVGSVLESTSDGSVTVGEPDTQAPVIALLGDNPLELTVGDTYNEPGATANDNVDGDISGNIVIDASAVDTANPGSYEVTYNVSDAAGNAAPQVIRTVNVNPAPDTTPPVISLLGDNPLELTVGDTYNEPGATASDDVDGDISGNIVIDASAVDTNTVGSYSVTYNVSDAAGNAAVEKVRTVNVSEAPDTTPPVISLNGAAVVNHEAGTQYMDAGATATDNVDGSVPVINDALTVVNVNQLDTYTVTFTAEDAAGNTATAERTVNVVDTTDPVITLNGAAVIDLLVGDVYNEPGATVTDFDSAVTVQISGSVDTATVGSYIITYNATDASGNSAEEVTRTVNVLDKVELRIDPAVSNVFVGDTFSVTMQLMAGSTLATGVDVHLTFDPAVLQVQSLDNTASPFNQAWNEITDNTQGTIRYSSGVLGSQVNGTVTVVIINFQAIATSTGTEIGFSTQHASEVTNFDGAQLLGATTPGSVVVNEVPNQDPIAVGDSFTTDEDTPLTGNVLSNDSDPDTDDLTVTDDTEPSYGDVAVDANGDFTYTPDADFNGTDSFTYTISDGNGGTDTATVNITVDPVGAAFSGSFTIPGRVADNYIAEVFITLYEVGTNNQVGSPLIAYSDASGNFTVEDLLLPAEGTYDIGVKTVNTLRVIETVALVNGDNGSVDFGALVLGDINNDNFIDLGDFSLYSSVFGLQFVDAGYLPAADLNNDGFIDLGDFSLYSGNFGLIGLCITHILGWAGDEPCFNDVL